MATYQKGSLELSGKWYYVRFRLKVSGQKKRKKMRERVCPAKGPGSLNPKQREVRAQQIVDASGANDAFLEKTTNPEAAQTVCSCDFQWISAFKILQRRIGSGFQQEFEDAQVSFTRC